MIIRTSICLSDIPKDKVFNSDKTGKDYVFINVSKRREVDKYGNDYSCYLYNSETKEKKYIGSGKSLVYKNTALGVNDTKGVRQASVVKDDDIPF